MNEREGWLRRLDESGVPALLARLILAAMFIYMGSVKIADPVEFLKQVRLFRVLPESPPHFLNATAIVLPWLEVVVGTALLVGLHVRGAALAAVIMLSVFTPAIFIRALEVRAAEGISFFEVKFDCGCGSGVVVIWTKLLTNLLLFALAFVVMMSRSSRFLPAKWIETRLMSDDSLLSPRSSPD